MGARATTPPQPTATPVPAGASITIRGFVVGGSVASAPAVGATGGSLSGTCGADVRVLISFAGLPDGSTISSDWTRDGSPTGAFTSPLGPVGGAGSSSFPHTAQVGGTYKVSIRVNSGPVLASGSVSFTC